MRRLRLDYETRCALDLKVVGAHIYAAEAQVLMCAYQIDDEPVLLWEPHKSEIPSDLLHALTDERVEKWAFNAQFERLITRDALKIDTPVRGWRCTMALAYLNSFTGGLDDVASQIGLPVRKDKEGSRLIRLFSTPRSDGGFNDWSSHPDEWQRFTEYCVQDVKTERALHDWLAQYPVPDREWLLYEIDQIINDRGLPVDTDFVVNAIAMADRRKKELLDQLNDLTGLKNANSTSQFIPWLRKRGYPFDDLQKFTVQKVLKNPPESLTDEAFRALKLRQWAARTSVRKMVALDRSVSWDRRARGLYQFAGASRTGRWAGRRVQTQNLPRTPKIIEDHAELEKATEIVRRGDYAALSQYPEPMEVLVGVLRSAFRAPEHKQFVVCDLSSIESVVIGWLAGCERLLNVFREGRDAYKDFATVLYGVSYDQVTKQMRTDSKPAVLGAGYRLGGGKMQDGKKTGLWGYAENMGIDLTREQAHKAVEVFRYEAYKEIPNLWYDLEEAVARVMKRNVSVTVGGKIQFRRNGPFLEAHMPSGSVARYYKPAMRMVRFYTDEVDENGERRFYEKENLTYMGQDQKSGKWTRLHTHGGKLTENFVQKIARDVLADGLINAHEEGFNIVGHVHDEIKALANRGSNAYTVETLRECMIRSAAWRADMPLNAAGWSGAFYRKD